MCHHVATSQSSCSLASLSSILYQNDTKAGETWQSAFKWHVSMPNTGGRVTQQARNVMLECVAGPLSDRTGILLSRRVITQACKLTLSSRNI